MIYSFLSHKFRLIPTGGTGVSPVKTATGETPVPPRLGSLATEARLLTHLTLGLLLLGVICRLVRYLLAPPLWCDEVFISLNFVNTDYERLAGPLEFSQVAPILFLWAEKAAYQLLGSSEWALRLLPLLAGLAALPLFWHLARLTLPSLAATIATGTFALARWPMALSNLVKPYSLDLLWSLILVTLAVHWLRRPDKLRYLMLLTLLGPIALFASFPVVFVAGTVSLLLLPHLLSASWRARCLYLAYNVLIAAAFLGGYAIGQAQLGPDNSATRAYMQECWKDGFMPLTSLAATGRWLLATHTGELMSYPFGDRNGVGTPTLLFCLAGVWWCVRHRPSLVLLCLLPFGLSLLAAALRKYPYGAEPRLDQHLAPFICLLVGAGGAALIERLAQTSQGRLRGALAAGVLLAAAGIAVSFMGTSKPSYWEREALWARKIANEVRTQATGGDQVVVLEPQARMMPTLRWQLLRLGTRVRWDGDADWSSLSDTDNRLWLLSLRCGPGRPYAQGITLEGGTVSPLWVPYGLSAPGQSVRDRLVSCLTRGGPSWAPLDHVAYTLQGSDCDTAPIRCDFFLCGPSDQPNTKSRYVLSSWPR